MVTHNMSNMGDSHRIISVIRNHFGQNDDPVHTGVEVGTHRGLLSAQLLQEFKKLMLWMVDSYSEHDPAGPYAQSGDSLSKLTYDEQTEHMKAAEAATQFAFHRRHLLRLPSLKAVERIPCKRIAFVFLDGSHAIEDVRDDIAVWWPRVEPGGLLSGHDFGHRRYTGVKQAVEEFSQRESLKIGRSGSCWYIAKPGELFIPPPPPPGTESLRASKADNDHQGN